MKIVVIGGTGLIGSKVVAKLEQRGHHAVGAAPNTGVDTVTGNGLAEAIADAEVLIDVSNSRSLDEQEAMSFFETSGRNIIGAEAHAGVKHHVALSVVGTERLQGSGYFRAKLAQELLIMSSPIPFTLVRATQFFEFMRAIAQASTVGDQVHLPPVQFQPMAADDVANMLVDVALAAPFNSMIEIGGPETFTMDEAIGDVLDYDQDPREVTADPEAKYFGVKLSETTLVPDRGARLGSTKLGWWLQHALGPRNGDEARVGGGTHHSRSHLRSDADEIYYSLAPAALRCGLVFLRQESAADLKN